MYDLVAFGETMIRFTPDGYNRLGQSGSLQLHVGGSESNTAVGLSRLGKRVAWVSRLTDNPLGRTIERSIRAQGVDTSHVVWTPCDRVGLYFLENGSPPRNSQVVYDRRDSAFARFPVHEIPRDLFRPGISRWLHVTGISLGLNSYRDERGNCDEIVGAQYATAEAVRLAKEAGWKVSFDVNYRALLWNTEQARSACHALLESADLVFLAHRDAEMLWNLGCGMDFPRAMKQLLSIRQGRPTVMTLGDEGAIAGYRNEIEQQAIVPVEPIGRLGGGDAFSAGFLGAWMEREDLRFALRWATSVARLKYSIPGDMPLIERTEVERLVQSATTSVGEVVR